jgi:hypothetical protein
MPLLAPFCSGRVRGYVAQSTGRIGLSNKTIRNYIVKANKSYSLDFERIDLRKKIWRPGLATTCLKSLLCKEVRLVAPPAVPFCFVLLARARWASPRALYVHSTSHWVAKFQLLELSNVSSSNWNLVAHIPTGHANLAVSFEQVSSEAQYGGPCLVKTASRSCGIEGWWSKSSLNPSLLNWNRFLSGAFCLGCSQPLLRGGLIGDKAARQPHPF